MPDRCDYDPVAHCAAGAQDEGCQNEAVISLKKGRWHLCESCAALPEFNRFRKRSRIDEDREGGQ